MVQKIYDVQEKKQSHFIDFVSLYETMLMGSSCECGEGYDVLDEKDGQMKCNVCKKAKNIDKMTDEEIIQELEEVYGFKVRECS